MRCQFSEGHTLHVWDRDDSAKIYLRILKNTIYYKNKLYLCIMVALGVFWGTIVNVLWVGKNISSSAMDLG